MSTNNNKNAQKIQGFRVDNPNGTLGYGKLCKLQTNTNSAQTLYNHLKTLEKSEKNKKNILNLLQKFLNETNNKSINSILNKLLINTEIKEIEAQLRNKQQQIKILKTVLEQHFKNVLNQKEKEYKRIPANEIMMSASTGEYINPRYYTIKKLETDIYLYKRFLNRLKSKN
uniref:Uncharacterized protein n=1 Tax=viral metagenome TaxID=1070528 RepID=A0A6C0FBN8_9ZZZZ